MGQKVNPKVFRLGTIYNWDSRWFDDKRYSQILLEDYKLRKAIMERLKGAGVSQVEIERSINSIKLTAYVSRPGMVIGRGGAGLEELKKFLEGILFKNKAVKNKTQLDIKIEPIKEPNLDAYLVAKNVSDQLARRLPHKRVMGQAVERAMLSGAKGIRIIIAGRIGGAEIGRREKLQQGTVPLSTIRENISFASVPSLTKKGYVGVKVWINK
ncbi:MAG: 30S ribosomal protein S3 [Candidatus Levybacteria bacterium RIFOXYA1_FULL_41_10]|uniref:30S ribosomal protein S3 n=1 Tax=uncultured organism TaxID=155900 RepID=U3GQ47_9ZZZZ|nr:30S ribosomal protein S3 [uncultured organism]KKR16894.1 MAG: 30S ribosomal protein S3 [Candidatus Levybacteria bacterium GW2011_GWA1_39_34]KKR50662.1 MAG: 30S ribosomal protein S3 [Candidatus Levybacteria bacterium GW2011_GWC1_40_19]KKR72541.1 MAG: 30S ribosomal protein S3 [Candidatus Levybacteria bacterium GW2011_GWC2_40_7]KKR95347.1 MAG: 30S ribosomal protein S3 [Candidatus Levybacteria bacterium GW2011_GWA2_41_15]KKS01844.1 MAG: 30S ribosomal protein S3 [Candidatus Levybacteria bacteriu